MLISISMKDTASAKMAAIPSIASSPGALNQGGEKLRDSIMVNLGAKGPNSRFPGATTNYWQRAAQSTTHPTVSGNAVTVSITQIGVRYNYFGGTIKAPWKNGSDSTYLTIPACEEAYGHRAREFSDLTVAFLGRSTSGAPILALVKGIPRVTHRATIRAILRPVTSRKIVRYLRNLNQPIKTPKTKSTQEPKNRLNVMYWLVTQSTKKPDPTVLPPLETMKLAFTKGVRSYVRGRINKNKLTP